MICNIIEKIDDLIYEELIQLGLYIDQLTEHELLCYNEKYNSKLKDLFLALEYNGIYIRKEFFEFIVNDRLINKHVMPIAYARQQLNKCNSWNQKTEKLAKDSKLDWSQLKKLFIKEKTTKEVKDEIWKTSTPKLLLK